MSTLFRSKDSVRSVADGMLARHAAQLRRALRLLSDEGLAANANEHVARIRREMKTMEAEMTRRGLEPSPDGPPEPRDAQPQVDGEPPLAS
jgi:hypothetical protein